MKPDALFWAKVDKSGECWLWTGAKSASGYGQLRRGGVTHYAHRYILGLEGASSTGVVDHICHVRACVNPAHLRMATEKQNNENRLGANSNSRSGVRGVFFCNTFHRWFGTVTHNRRVHRKSFASADEAECWVIAKRNELFSHNDADRLSA